MYQQWNMLIFKIGDNLYTKNKDIAERYEKGYIKKYSIFHVQYCYSGNSPQIDL